MKQRVRGRQAGSQGQPEPVALSEAMGERAKTLSPQAFYEQLIKRPDIRELLKRLAQ